LKLLLDIVIVIYINKINIPLIKIIKIINPIIGPIILIYIELINNIKIINIIIIVMGLDKNGIIIIIGLYIIYIIIQKIVYENINFGD